MNIFILMVLQAFVTALILIILNTVFGAIRSALFARQFSKYLQERSEAKQEVKLNEHSNSTTH